MCHVLLMHCRQSLKHDPGHPFDLLFLELLLYVVEVVGKLFIYHDLLIQGHIHYLSKGAVATKVSGPSAWLLWAPLRITRC